MFEEAQTKGEIVLTEKERRVFEMIRRAGCADINIVIRGGEPAWAELTEQISEMRNGSKSGG